MATLPRLYQCRACYITCLNVTFVLANLILAVMMMMPCVEELPRKGMPTKGLPSMNMLPCKVGMSSQVGGMPSKEQPSKGLPSLHNTEIKVPSNTSKLSQARETWKL